MIRAYVNRMHDGHGPVIVEVWVDGFATGRTYCYDVEFAGKVRLRSVQGKGLGFRGHHNTPVHTWVEADAVESYTGVTHEENLQC